MEFEFACLSANTGFDLRSFALCIPASIWFILHGIEKSLTAFERAREQPANKEEEEEEKRKRKKGTQISQLVEMEIMFATLKRSASSP